MHIRSCKLISEINILPIILAAGKGTRMHSSIEQPKPLTTYNGKALIDYAIEPVIDMGLKKIHYVLSFGSHAIKQYVSANSSCYYQKTESIFTIINDQENINYFLTLKCLADRLALDQQHSAYLLIPADIVGLTTSLLIKMKNMLKHCDGVVLTQLRDQDSSDNEYRRIISNGTEYLWSTGLKGISKTALRFNLSTEDITSITEVPTGIYLLSRKCLLKSIDMLQEGESLSDVFNHAVSLNYVLKIISLNKATIFNLNYKKDLV